MWHFPTSKGIFYIVPKDGRFAVMFQNEILGSYGTPQLAADDVAGGHTFTPSCGVDTSTLGIPEDLGSWIKGPPAR